MTSKKIVFVNFAPIAFQGGVERWMLRVSKELNLRQVDTHFIFVGNQISNIYASLVLNRKFDSRIKTNIQDYSGTAIGWGHIIPFSKRWKAVRSQLLSADKIYFKLEIPELVILVYFGGFSALMKSIAGVRSCYYYQYPEKLLDHLHNSVYFSRPLKYILKRIKLIHVLTSKDELLFRENLQMRSIVKVPNYVDTINDQFPKDQPDASPAKIIYVGEISRQKGADVLIDIINKLAGLYQFLIIGDGPMAPQVKALTEKHQNIEYLGHVPHLDLAAHYCRSDIFIFPSRAEGLANVLLEAMSHGLYIINSDASSLNMPSSMENSIMLDSNLFSSAISEAANNIAQIRETKLQRIEYCKCNYSKEVVLPVLLDKVFNIV